MLSVNAEERQELIVGQGEERSIQKPELPPQGESFSFTFDSWACNTGLQEDLALMAEFEEDLRTARLAAVSDFNNLTTQQSAKKTKQYSKAFLNGMEQLLQYILSDNAKNFTEFYAELHHGEGREIKTKIASMLKGLNELNVSAPMKDFLWHQVRKWMFVEIKKEQKVCQDKLAKNFRD